MKKFFKDFWVLQKHSNTFMKEHWKGYLVLCSALTAAELAYFYYKDEIVDTFKEKLSKE